jgi:hypothetical protein
MIHMIAFAAAFLACLVYVFATGGKPERLAMLAQSVALLLSLVAISFRVIPSKGLPVGLALVDLALAVALSLLALRANRYWTIVLAGMQVAPLFAHAARLLAFPLPAAGYVIFVQLWAWPMLAVTAAGARNHRARVRKFGEEQDWKPFWPHLNQVEFTV